MTKFRHMLGIGLMIGAFLWGGGCATTGQPKVSSGETPDDVKKAIEKVADVIVNKSNRAKYCPVCGRHYSATQDICPVDHAGLKEVEE